MDTGRNAGSDAGHTGGVSARYHGWRNDERAGGDAGTGFPTRFSRDRPCRQPALRENSAVLVRAATRNPSRANIVRLRSRPQSPLFPQFAGKRHWTFLRNSGDRFDELPRSGHGETVRWEIPHRSRRRVICAESPLSFLQRNSNFARMTSGRSRTHRSIATARRGDVDSADGEVSESSSPRRLTSWMVGPPPLRKSPVFPQNRSQHFD